MVTSVEREKNISSRQIFRLASVLYAEDSSLINSKEVIKGIIESCLFENPDNEMSIDDISAYCMNEYYINFTFAETKKILEENFLVFQYHTYDNYSCYFLSTKRREEIEKGQKKNIEHFITWFIQNYSPEKERDIQEAIYKFLYELTTTNINSYKRLLSLGINNIDLTDSDLSINQSLFNEEEKSYINSFLVWDNAEKNNALTDIILCCLEYCLLISGDSKNDLTENFIKGKTIFLDTNIIFRALGINGSSRKSVIISFLEKCKQGKVNICIASYTEREFFNTVSHYCQKIASYARGKINTDLYSGLSDYSIFSFYNEWRQLHEGLSFKYFTVYIKAIYNELLETFGIINDSKVPYNPFDEKEKVIIDKYNNDINHIKQDMLDENYYYNSDEYYINTNTHDANLILWIERRREMAINENGKGDCYLISSDKSLRYWDMIREKKTNPIVIYPSHFFAILIKTCGRAKNDMKSFVSFINLRPKINTIRPDKVDAILSGISVVTEDITTQKELINLLMEDGFSSILKDNCDGIEVYERTKLFSMNYLKNEFKKQEQDLQDTNKKMQIIEAKVKNLEDNNKFNALASNLLVEKNGKLEQTIFNIAKRNTRFLYVIKAWVIPVIILVYFLTTSCFILFQFIFCDNERNISRKIIDYIAGKTIFGTGGDATPYVIDGVLLLSFRFLYKPLKKYLFSKSNRKQLKNNLVQSYIEDNKLYD